LLVTFSNPPAGVYTLKVLFGTSYAYVGSVGTITVTLPTWTATSTNSGFMGGGTVTFSGSGFSTIKTNNLP